MRTVLIGCLMCATAVLAQAQIISVEGGVDVLRGDFNRFEGGVVFDPMLSAAGAVSYQLQVSDLRSYYGLRVEGYIGDYAIGESKDLHGGSAALLAWRAFPFDLEGDCDCPTWGDDNWLKKAIFIEGGAGYGRQLVSSSDDGAAARYTNSSHRQGLGYFARLGLAHRLGKSIDVYAAAGLHGLFAKDEGFGVHNAALRPVLGVSYRL